MTLFPQLGPEYYGEKDKDLMERMEWTYSQSITINQSFWSEADIDTRFEAGDQTLYNDIYGNLPAFRKQQFNFNRIRRVVNMISGYQRKNRKSTVVVPIENSDDATSTQFTKMMFWANQREGILETVSQSFHGALVTGMNLLNVWMDYRSDPVSGDIRVDNCAYNSYLIDPFFKKQDLSDCNFIWKRSWVTKEQAASLLPEHKEEVAGMQPSPYHDSRFQFMPESYNYGMKNLLTYDEYWYRDFRKQKMLVDTQTGETLEWKSQNDDGLEFFLQQYPQITVIEHEIPTVRLGIILNNRVMYHGPNPMGIDKYPFVPVLGYYNPQMPYFPWRIQGVVRGLRDAQYLYNRRKVIELDILESQINSGFKYKEDALVNPKDIYLQGQGRGLAIKQEAQMSDVEQIVAPQIPPSMIQLSEILGREIQEISGVNEELLGSADDDKAGILSMLRQGAGLTTLQVLFDQLDHSQKLLGNIMLDLFQANFTPGKIKRIIGEEPAPQFYNKAFGKFDSAIEEGLNTTTQKQFHFAQLLQMREAGIPIPTEQLLKSSTIQDKDELIEAIAKEEQQQAQMQQMQAQLAMQEQEAKVNLANARAQADRGLGIERMSRIQENAALAEERKAEAQKDRQLGTLHIVEAIKKLEEIDINQLQKLLDIADRIKERENQPREVEEKEETLDLTATLGG